MTSYVNGRGKETRISEMHDVHLNNAIKEACAHYNKGRDKILNALIAERKRRSRLRKKVVSSLIASLRKK